MAKKPTEQAEFNFKRAEEAAMSIVNGLKPKNDPTSTIHYNTSVGITHLARGMGHLAVGLRATYLLLEEVNRKLDAQARGGRA
ncbi:MAG: hypothetical protein IPK81_08770 [Rhodospirillales bacterium]|nr:MAG: hypothetical protein IPK81_08770 [Rhodospirillales bacterium]